MITKHKLVLILLFTFLIMTSLLTPTPTGQGSNKEDGKVKDPGFQLKVDPEFITVEQGQSSTVNATFTANKTFTGQVTLSVTVLPEGLTPIIKTPSIPLTPSALAKSEISFKAESNSPKVSYEVTIIGKGEWGTRTAKVMVEVVGASATTPPTTPPIGASAPGIPTWYLAVFLALFSLISALAFVLGRQTSGKKVSTLISPQMTAGLQIGLRSDKGGRESNEDSAVSMVISSAFRSQSKNRIVLAVADGMGGYRAGDLASATCLKVLTENLHPYLESTASVDFCNLMNQALLKANSEIQTMSSERAEASGMGTTVVATVADDRDLYVAWVGDSRAYIIRRGRISRLTKDHSMVQELVDQGQLTTHEARLHPDRNIVKRSIGRRTNVMVDTRRVSIEPNDVILLCSDGLTDLLEDNGILSILISSRAPQQACNKLIETCLRRGASDNITVIVAAFNIPTE